MACIAVLSAFGDERTIVLETKVVETFDNTDGDDGSKYDWRLEASKFATKTKDADGNVTDSWPKVAYIDAWPEQFFRSTEDTSALKSLGIWGKFDRRGYNWIDVYPVEKGGDENAGAVTIPMVGRLQYIDLWVWGSNLRYSIEAYFRDYNGIMYVIGLGSINHTGWKNLRAPVPASIPQAKTVLPKFAALDFVKFRIWTEPTERVDNFYVYLDHFKVLTDTFETPFDGDKLEDPAKVDELWGGK
ncbi:MAG: flagellar filament outer layer protein FlaA [Spirochaetaceae bacterium]|jgi:hypothetical protein|nr:flagellar filament outer layer protein FlaA [Spirochaetaceae bacterium]